jgi:hypothetical protein
MDTIYSFGADFSKALYLIQDKVLNVFFTFLVDARQVGIKIMTKVISGAMKLIKWMKGFYQKHPILCKAIVLFILFIIYLILGSDSAHAASSMNDVTTGLGDAANSIPKDKIEVYQAAIGFIDDMRKTGVMDDSETSLKIVDYIKDISDGKLDNETGFSTESIQRMGQAALETVRDLKTKAVEGDRGALEQICRLIDKGMKLAPAK